MSGVTVKDIALKAGVSVASVSVALNGKPGVSETTRQAILSAALSLGYNVSKNARSNAKTICYLIYIDQEVGIAQETTFSSFVLKGVETAAKELGYRILIRHCYSQYPLSEQITDILQDVSGLLILGTDLTSERKSDIDFLLHNHEISIPVVILDNFTLSSYVDCVGNDNLYGAKSAMSYLIDHGHRRLGYIRAKQRITNFDDRENGILMAIREHLGVNTDLFCVVPADISAEKAYQDICVWLSSNHDLPDAFFAENDVIAAAAIRAFNSYGISVPETVSIVGFDDIPVCEMVNPSITTIHSFKEKLGSEAVSLLHKRIINGDTVQSARATGVVKLALSTRIVERKSTISK